MKEMKALCPVGALGYGFPVESFEEGLKRGPDFIGVDAGSTDPGPYYLGSGEAILSWDAQKRDLEIILEGRQRLGIPFIIGSAGGSGSEPGLDKTIAIIKDIAKEKGYNLKIARIAADMDKEFLKSALNDGKIKTFESAKELTAEDIDSSDRIVAQMGMEPYIEAFKMGADVIVAGRSYDPAVFAALPIMKGYDPGLAIHMGKILECGAMAADPTAGFDSILGTIGDGYFDLEPMSNARVCTVKSVAAHTFYEKENPVKLALPGGSINLTETTFDQINDRVVRVAKTQYIKADKDTVKLEGSKTVGHRSIFIAGAKDPILIRDWDTIIKQVEKKVIDELSYVYRDDYQLVFHVYGKNGVMRDSEYLKDVTSHELGIVGEAVGRTQEIAHDVCLYAHGALLHFPYEGRKQTAGNLAFLYSPSDFKVGKVFEFSIYHLLEVGDPLSLFPITLEDI